MGDKMREEFEAWYADHFSCAIGKDCSAEIIASMREGDLYGDRGYLNGCWIGWKASRAALVVELPESHSADEYMGFTRVIREADIESAFEAAGIKVKS